MKKNQLFYVTAEIAENEPKSMFGPHRAKIDPLNSIKSNEKYIWGYSPLSEESNEPIYVRLLRYLRYRILDDTNMT